MKNLDEGFYYVVGIALFVLLLGTVWCCDYYKEVTAIKAGLQEDVVQGRKVWVRK